MTDLPRELQAAGAKRRSASAPDPVTLDWLQSECEREERILRLQYPETEGSLAPDDELALASYKPPSDTTQALRLWRYIGHLNLARFKGMRVAANTEEAEEAARKLLVREPVTLTLESGRRVALTGRSWNAYRELAARGERLRLIETALEEVQQRFAAARTAWLAAGLLSRRRLKRRMNRLEELHRRGYNEWALHRERIYATATTDSGAVAAPSDAAPDWWRDTTIADEQRVISALWEAGPGRYLQLGQPPARKQQTNRGEVFGWHSLMASLEKHGRVPPAEIYDQDWFRLLARERAAAPPPLEEALADG